MRSNTTTKETNINSKKIEDTSKMLENIRKQGSNKQCFDCGEKNSKNIWLAKFDTKKDKLPDSKDFDAVKKHITLKYKDKKYAVKNPEKEIAGEVPKNSNTGKKNERSDDESDSDSESEKEKAAKMKKKSVPIPSNTNKVNTVLPDPVENTSNKKLAPLNMKNTPTQPNANLGKNKSSVQESKSIDVNGKNNDWADQKDFTFLDDYSQGSKSGNKTQQVTNNNTLIDTNLFSFSPNNGASASTQATKSKKNNLDDEWGLVWENPSQTSKSPIIINQNNNFEFFDTNFNSNTNEISSNQINQGKDTKARPSINQQSPIMNNLDFNLAGLNTPSTITSNSKSNTMTTSAPNTNNISSLNQNLSSVYSNNQTHTTQTNPNKKNYDDLDKYLSDPTLYAPNNVGNQQNSHTAPSYGNMNMNTMNNMNPMNQAMQGGSNNMLNMNPQMMQQMQMMMMNPQMQSNPQMIQYMQMMLNNMMTANINVNATALNNNVNLSPPTNYGGNMHTQSKVDSHFNDISDMNFNMNGLNIGQNDLPLYGKVEEPVQKVDAFKDIYNYSKQNQSQPVKENKSFENNNLYSKSLLQTGMTNSTNSNTSSNVTNTPAYNPFDF